MRKINRALLKKLLQELVDQRRSGRKELSAALKCSVNTIDNWLRAQYRFGLKEYHAREAAKFFGVSVDELFPNRETDSHRAG